MKIIVKESMFHGKHVLSLYDAEAKDEYKNYPVLTIGVRKAKAIVEAYDEIKKFCARKK